MLEETETEKKYAISLGPGSLAMIVISTLAIGGGGTSLLTSRLMTSQPVIVNIDANLEHRLTVIEQSIDRLDATIRSSNFQRKPQQ